MGDRQAEQERRGFFWVAAFFVAVPLLYLGSWFAACWAVGNQWISLEAYFMLTDSVFVPIVWYMSTGQPGAQQMFIWSMQLAQP